MRFYLEPALYKSAAAGEHNFISKIAKVLENSQFEVEYCDTSPAELPPFEGYSLIHMKPPVGMRGLTFRRVYHYPFWQIEQTHARWDWQVACMPFAPKKERETEAVRFYQFWQKRLFGDAPQHVDRKGFVYLPLQGRLLEHRSFQSCSPLQMIEHCLHHDPDRRIVATLHPKETYDQIELEALENLQRRNSRLDIQKGRMEEMLRNCDYVVTQNSSAAFSGYFFGKPALLFGKIDFHHIAAIADMDQLASSFAQVQEQKPNYAQYLWWFWQQESINAGRAEAQEKIAFRLKSFGWPIK